MKRLTLIALALAALIWTGTGQAKELSSFKVCGASACKAVSDPALLRSLIRSVENQGEPVSTRTPRPAPFYRLEFYVKGDESGGPSLVQYYAPSAGRIAIETNPDAWTWVQANSLRTLFGRVTTDVRPFPAPRIARVLVGAKPVHDPTSYARLFGLRTPTDEYPDDGNWVTISIETAKPTPWSTGAATLEYSLSKNVL